MSRDGSRNADRPRRLADLLRGAAADAANAGAAALSATGDEAQGPLVRGIAFDSRRVQPGDAFFCLIGVHDDGHRHVREAQRRGAAALVVERPLPWFGGDLPQVVVPDTRRALGYAASRWFGQPAAGLNLVGVTGTNGKTTVTYMLESILRTAGRRVGRVGTNGIFDGVAEGPPHQTTPEPLLLQQTLARMRRNNVDWVVMEVSSHALAQERVLGCRFRYGVLTNIERDHFDYHADRAAYVRAKLRLFGARRGPLGDETTETAVVHGPLADLLERPEVAPRFRWNAGEIAGAKPPANGAGHGVGRFERGRQRPGGLARATGPAALRFGDSPADDVRAAYVRLFPGGSHFRLRYQGHLLPIQLRVPGAYNVDNALAAAGVALHAGLSPEVVRRGLENYRGVAGRVQRVEAGQPFTVLVDFAHNPASLAALLEIPVPVAGGRRILVFGAEGGKDPGKRPEMGRVAAAGADYAVVTSDNAHSEHPERIIAEILRGWGPGGCPVEAEPDRARAIARALTLAQPGDLVLIAGKGHEQTIVGSDGARPFSDAAVAARILRERGGDGPSAAGARSPSLAGRTRN